MYDSILLHYDSFEYSFRFSYILYYMLADGKHDYVSLGFSIKGWPNLAQDSSSIFIQNHHQWSPPLY